MRFLKRLHLHGYKTFASPTEFVFDGGVTAVVGPNGSGKSNIADALRWVLGEQSYGTLRGKRTEDMIFSGSEQRPRLGMAYVSLTLDNSSGWLPTEFSEVEIARRAYRSGENEYFLNGNRVRLREVSELLASSGLSERTYTVIGQGLVDQALSQRPEERRRLFEEAAGITVHQHKREQAAQRLAEAQANLTRARDILTELTPRLRYLKGQARRAQEYQQIRQDLEANLRVWYAYKWRQAQLGLAAAQKTLEAQTGAAEAVARQLEALVGQAATRREERARLREQLGEWHQSSSLLHRQAEAVQRDLAVRTEQVRLWGEQRDGLEEEAVRLRAWLEDSAGRLQAAQAALAEIEARHRQLLEQLAIAEGEVKAREEERLDRSRRLAEAQEAVLTLRTRLSEQGSLLAQSEARRAELAQADAEQERGAAAAARALAEVQRQAAALADRIAALEAELAAVAQERQAAEAALADAQAVEREAQEHLSATLRARERLQDQYDMLTRLREEGAGLGAGPRAVMAARERLGGIVGPLGDLIEVPPELERAIEAALAGRVQDIVVERWDVAESAVAYLNESRAGRATFLPLDTLRPPPPADAPRAAGVLGLASRLVGFDERVRPAVELALNRVLVVEDLATARRLLRSAGQGPTLVTLQGEIVRPGGSVTGGRDDGRRDSGLLSRARALRKLPLALRDAAGQIAAGEARVAEAGAARAAAAAELEGLRRRQEELGRALETLRAERNRLELEGERARQAQAWHADRRREIAREAADLEGREAAARAALAGLSRELAEAEAAAESLRRELASAELEDLQTRVALLRAEVAVSEGQGRAYRARVEELKALQAERAADCAAKEGQIRSLGAQIAEASQAMAEQERMAAGLAGEIAALAARIEPVEARLAALEREQRAAEAQEQALREELRRAQMAQTQAELALQRAQDESAHLRSEIEKELGLVTLGGPDATAESPGDSQPPLPLGELVTPLPPVVTLPPGLDEDVRNLRGQLARLGPVNLEALAEYQEVEARCNFLSAQITDLEKAVASLQDVIAELDRVMEREFLTTFRAVAAQFREEFRDLFNGGSARLVLTDPDSPGTTGVEIVARPPGKREQSLALLSGGERALTAAALIFSILKCRPTPFCMLDEVDAMLDEANVGRFREKLRELSQQTQFILITHNRGTIEVADTIYGVSMGADNTSQVLSLRLQGKEVMPAARADLD